MEHKRKCIYVLEDNDDIRELIALLLMEEDYEVHGYPSVKSFKKEMAQGRPDLIIMDVMLGDGNGIDVCDELKSSKVTHDIPVVLMSAHAGMNGFKSKAEDFIPKPFDINEFVKKIDKHLQ